VEVRQQKIAVNRSLLIMPAMVQQMDEPEHHPGVPRNWQDMQPAAFDGMIMPAG
jgi:hypothetical protein